MRWYASVSYFMRKVNFLHCIFLRQVRPFMLSLNVLLYSNCCCSMLGPVCTFCRGSVHVHIFILIGWDLLLQIVHKYGKFSVRNPRSIDHDHLIVIISSLWIRPRWAILCKNEDDILNYLWPVHQLNSAGMVFYCANFWTNCRNGRLMRIKMN